MTAAFDLFVIFAAMRTGSNLLEANLNALDGVRCHGEAFNPYFIAYPDHESLLGFTQAERDANPLRLVEALRAEPGLNGFRFFPDHDARVCEALLDDRRCAKILLTRNPLESYVSRKIAEATGQWKLTELSRRRASRVRFEPDEFEAHLAALLAFRSKVLRHLQVTGQTAFHLTYEDLRSVEVLNGLASHLGVAARLERTDRSLTIQNPQPVAAKVTNPDQMAQALEALDPFGLEGFSTLEPARAAGVSGYVAAATAPLLYLPVRGGPEARVRNWLAALDVAHRQDPVEGMSQKTLRQWMRLNPGHRSFTVLRHPALRAHDVFCRRVLCRGDPRLAGFLERRFGLDLPQRADDAGYDLQAHRRAFLGFLDFLQANLSGQTALGVDAAWCSQSQALLGFAGFAPPDMVFRESEMETELPRLAQRVGCSNPPIPAPETPQGPFAFADVHDAGIEARVASIYRRDYLVFGFETWGETAA
ncbi:nodulation protein NodH [Sulfitobacter sp. LCG007]